MGFVAAGLAVAAVGAGASAYGSNQQASASRDAAKFAGYLENKFAEKQKKRLNELIEEKEEKLLDINDTLDRFGGGPTAGSEENLELIRKAQEDYLKMGAGDFSAFEDQLKDIMASTVANSFGAGSPVGSFTQLSAQNVNNLRQQGISTGLSIGGTLARESFGLMGAEFGLMDEEFHTWRDIEGRNVTAQGGAQMQAAQSAGSGWASTGSFLTSLGGAIAGYGTGLANGSITAPIFGGTASGGAAGDIASSIPMSARPYDVPSVGSVGFQTPSAAPFSMPSLPVSVPGFNPMSVPSGYGGGVLPPINGYNNNDPMMMQQNVNPYEQFASLTLGMI